MPAATDNPELDRELFVSEFTTLCNSLDAPHSLQTVNDILDAFEQHIDKSVLWLRCTSKRTGIINFRIAFHGRLVDTIAISARAGWIEIQDPLARLVRAWTSSFPGAEQWCDFDPSSGLAKTWVFFRRMQSVELVLSSCPAAIAGGRLMESFHARGLEKVTFTAVDYHSRTINLYFLVPDPLTRERAESFTALVDSTYTEEDFAIMGGFMTPVFTFAVTIAYETDCIQRVAFYASVPNAETFAPLDERVRRFFQQAPSHDKRKVSIVSWSYGPGQERYVKGEASYAGDLDLLSRNAFAGWTEG